MADRAFLDANVLFSAAYREGAGVARLWALPAVTLLTSEYAIEETRRNLSDPVRLQRLAELVGGCERAATVTLAPDARVGLELPEKDWPIMGGAVAAGATHLVTGDVRHFGRYFGTRVLGVWVMSPGQYLRSRR